MFIKPAIKLFIWQGLNPHGQHMQGELAAASINLVKQELIKQNIIVFKIKQKNKFHFQQKINISELIRELAALINAGVPLANSLAAIKRSTRNLLLQVITVDLIKHIESGKQLSAALKSHPHYFNEMICNLVDAGEQSGTLDKVLDHLADYLEQQTLLKRKVSKALFYPALVSIISIIVTVIMLVTVLPQFAQLFANYGAQLPLVTRILLNFSNGLLQYGWLILAIMVSLFFIGKLILKKSEKCKQKIDKLLLIIPLLGRLFKKIILTRCLHTLSLTINAGLPLANALAITAKVAQNRIYQQGILNIQQWVLAGQSLASAFQLSQLLSERDLEMLAIGEEAGKMDSMLIKLTEYYESQTNHIISQLAQVLEPAIMVVLSLIVGLLVIAMYMPIFKLGAVI